MTKNILAERPNRNTHPGITPQWIVWGNGRRIAHDWATVHAIMLDHHWSFLRIGACLIGYPAGTQEGHA